MNAASVGGKQTSMLPRRQSTGQMAHHLPQASSSPQTSTPTGRRSASAMTASGPRADTVTETSESYSGEQDEVKTYGIEGM